MVLKLSSNKNIGCLISSFCNERIPTFFVALLIILVTGFDSLSNMTKASLSFLYDLNVF